MLINTNHIIKSFLEVCAVIYSLARSLFAASRVIENIIFSYICITQDHLLFLIYQFFAII